MSGSAPLGAMGKAVQTHQQLSRKTDMLEKSRREAEELSARCASANRKLHSMEIENKQCKTELDDAVAAAGHFHALSTC